MKAAGRPGDPAATHRERVDPTLDLPASERGLWLRALSYPGVGARTPVGPVGSLIPAGLSHLLDSPPKGPLPGLLNAVHETLHPSERDSIWALLSNFLCWFRRLNHRSVPLQSVLWATL
ncbi:hypothetical protein Vretifemale_10557 [Volvox reticuliferus]|uniref:Uncharacterized protein n=1 Tax=Volvox reticuliferus TaxID=1737510 RepID=A0A8J4CIB5_9CHLO|nr:hypothetical protein Vretifemale_10557 [Volvox reticuliferus]